MADQPRKGLWARVKGVLGVPDEAEDEAPEPRPQTVSTFTASRLPPTDGGASIPDTLFPPSHGKWELYEDAWSDLDQRERAAPELPSDESAPAAPEQPSDEPAPAAPAPAEPLAAAAPQPPIAEATDDELSTTLESLTDAESPTDVLSHLDDDEVDALAQAVGLEEPSPPEPPTWRPTPDLDAVAPKGGGALFAEPPHEVRDRLAGAPPDAPPLPDSPPHPASTPAARAPAAPPQPTEAPSTSDAVERDAEAEAEAERRIEVHEQHLEAAAARARAQTAPRVHVHDDRLDRPAPPQLMNPSEAVALAERGRSARGPREDVGPAS